MKADAALVRATPSGATPDIVTDQPDPFGVMLRRLREGAGMTREELAERAGLSPRAISALERGERQRPYPHTVRALVTALSLSDGQQAALVQACRSPRRPAAPEWTPADIVGRDDEIDAVTGHLISGRAHLLTITGPGGVGKTQLAIAVGRRAGAHWTDGAVMVALAPLAVEASIVPAIAEALGLRDAGAVPLTDLLHRYLATRRVLVILDNLEHLPAAPAEVAALIAAAPNVVVLGTSRSPLRLRAERVFRLNPLEVDPAVELFRARAAATGLETSHMEPATLSRLCRSLDCLPLAIEIAAARSCVLPPEALLARSDPFTLLGDGAADLPERHRTLHGAIEWSYRLLNPRERSLFRCLAVFPDSWTLDAAAAVGGVEERPALERLARLIHLSLVSRQSDSAEPRFRYLATIRGYATEELAARGEADGARRRHAEFYRGLALAAHGVSFAPEFDTGMERLRVEPGNLAQSLGTLLERGDLEDFASMCFALSMYWARLGRLGEGRRWAAAGLAAGRPLSPRARGQLLMTHASTLFPASLQRQAVMELDQAAALLRQADDLEGLAWVLATLAVSTLLLGEPEQATILLDEVDHLIEQGLAPGMEGVVALQRAYVAHAQGRLEDAEGLLASVEARSRAEGSTWVLAQALVQRGSIALHQGDDERAADLEAEAVAVLSSLGDEGQTMAHAIMHMAQATATRAPRRAALFLGALDDLVERSGVTTMSPTLLPNPREQARKALGDAQFTASLAEGRRLTGPGLVALAMGG